MTHEIAVLSFNAVEATARAVQSLQQTVAKETKITVIDNASTDGTRTWLERQAKLEKVLHPQNLLYTKAYAAFLAQSQAEIVTLWNCDAEATEGWERPLLDWMLKTPKAGIVGPLLL